LLIYSKNAGTITKISVNVRAIVRASLI